jgi:uncharacterized protein YlxP (DUF503 family)
MTIGVYTFELHLPLAQSLKNKRQVVKRLKDRLKARHNVAVQESEEHSALWQRAGIAIVSVASNEEILVNLFRKIRLEAESLVPGELSDHSTDFIETLEGAKGDWTEDDS